jgi:tetratricopeptide (TPR) repeat protein
MDLELNQNAKLKSAMELAEELDEMKWTDLALEVLDRSKGYAANEEQEAQLSCRQGELNIKRGNYELAVIKFENAMGRLLQKPDSLELFNVYRNISWTHWRQGFLERAESFAEGAACVMDKREEKNDNETNKARASLLHLMALLSGARGDHQAALDRYHREVEILERYNYRERLGPAYGNICGIYRMRGNYSKAIEYQEQSVAIAEKAGDLLTVGIGYNNLGEIYHNLGDLERPEKFFNRYLEINTQIDNPIGDSFALAGLARLHEDWGDLARAEALYHRALVKAQAVKSRVREASIAADMAILYSREGRVEQALRCIEQAMDIYQQTGRGASQWHQVIKAGIWALISAREPDRGTDSLLLLEQTINQPIIIDDEQNLSMPEIALEAHTLLSRIYLGKGDDLLAGAQVERARFFIEQLLSSMPEEFRERFLKKPAVCEVARVENQLKQCEPESNPASE